MLDVSYPKDKVLVDECLKGKARAWDALVACYKPVMFAYFRRAGLDNERADALTADVLFSLVRREYAILRRYNPNRRPLRAFLRGLCRRRLSAQRKRAERDECSLEDLQTLLTRLFTFDDNSGLSIEDFLSTLTPRLLEFAEKILNWPALEPRTMTERERKLNRDLRKMLRRFLWERGDT